MCRQEAESSRAFIGWSGATIARPFDSALHVARTGPGKRRSRVTMQVFRSLA